MERAQRARSAYREGVWLMLPSTAWLDAVHPFNCCNFPLSVENPLGRQRGGPHVEAAQH